MSSSTLESKTQQQVVDMFLDVKKRLDQGSAQFLSKILPFDENRSTLMGQDVNVMLQFLKQVVIFLVKCKLELEDQSVHSHQSEYESLIQKLEADIRQHIRIEQQLRLYAESTQSKYDEALAENKILHQSITELSQRNNELSLTLKKAQQELQARLTTELETRQNGKQKTEGNDGVSKPYKIERPLKQLSDVTNKSKMTTEPTTNANESQSFLKKQACQYAYIPTESGENNFENKLNNFGLLRKKTQPGILEEHGKNQNLSQHRASQPLPDNSTYLEKSQIKTVQSNYNNSINQGQHTSNASSPLVKRQQTNEKQKIKSETHSIVKQSSQNVPLSNQQYQYQVGYRSTSFESNAQPPINYQQPCHQQPHYYRLSYI